MYGAACAGVTRIVTQETWQSVSVDQLQVGQFIRLGHRWFEHPFLLNRFRIASEKEIAIIRDARLTRLYVDPARSDSGAIEAPAAEALDAEASPGDAGATEQLQTRKNALAERVRGQHDMLSRTREQYGAAVQSCRQALELLAAGSDTALAAVGSLTQAMLALAATEERPLTFAAATRPDDGPTLRACRALDAAAIGAAVGRRLGLQAQALSTLTTAALVHAVGLEDLPSMMQEEATIRDPDLLADFQQYPVLGADLLGRCGGFSPDVVRIVRQHRERLDGSGFPEGKRSQSIHPHAHVIGAIREFQVLAERGDSMLPATALVHLFRRLRGAYGPAAVDNVIATLTIYPPGSFLALTDGSIGRVMQVSTRARLRPTVCLFDDTVTPSEAQIIDLADTDALSVERVLDPLQLAVDVREFFGSSWSGIAFARDTRAIEQAA
jgi:HD-GYP domain-containing protein (c-di-GMP phosphodiesterase class II)